MFRSPWFRNLLNVARTRKDRRRLAGKNRKPIRLALESLEERLTPSGGGPTVTQTAGSYSALTGLIAGDTAANTNYIIQITNSFTFNAGGQVTISKLDATSTLTIEGQNGTNFTLTGNGNRLFDVEGKTQNVTLENLTLTGGGGVNVSQGGAIKDQGGTVTLSSVTVKNNSVTISKPPFRTENGRVIVPLIAGGGGAFVSGGGSLNLTNTTIEFNTAQGIDGAKGSIGDPKGRYGQGGGIFVAGTSTIVMNGGSINNNSAIGGAGGNVTTPTTGGSGSTGTPSNPLSPVGSGGYGQGGGLFVYGPSTISINGGSIANNSAIGGAGANGGSTSTTKPEDGAVGGFAIGGGVFLSDAGWSMTLLGTTVAGNSVQGGAGGKGGTGLAGADGAPGVPGANGPDGTATNPNGGAGTAGGNGGIGKEGNVGGAGGDGGLAEGGGAYLQGGNFTMSGATFATNSVLGGTGGTGGTGGGGGNSGVGGKGGNGGNAFATPGAIGGNGGSGGYSGQVISPKDKVAAGSGGAGGVGGIGGRASGGGLFVDGNTGAHPLLGSLSSSPSTVTIKELTSLNSTTISSFLNNFATGGGGGVGGSGGAGGKGADGGMGGNGGTSGPGGSPGTPGVGGSGGTGGNGGVGGLGGASGAGSGGGLYVSPGSTLLISAANFQGNGAASGTGGTGGAGGLGGDGGNGGKGGTAGGATAKSGAGQESGHGGNGGGGGVADKAQGGAIYSSSTTTILNSSLIYNGTLGGQGGNGGNGGNAGNSGTGSTSIGSYNHAAGSVGGFGGNGAVYVPDSHDGEADGGGVYLASPPSGAIGPDRVINTTFAQNSATAGSAGAGGAKGFGGLIVNHLGMGRNGQNGALGTPGTGNGGGAYDIAATSTAFVNDTFYANSATTQGGGIYVDKSIPMPDVNLPIVVNTILENNQALDSPDYWGPLNLVSSFDFVSNTTDSKGGDTWTAAAPGHPLPPGTILNNNTPQLENTLSWVTLPGGAKSPYFYRLLPGSVAVGAGTATVLHDIAQAERTVVELPVGGSDSAAVDETLVNPRTFDSGNIIDMGAATFFTATSTLNLSFMPNSPITLPSGAKNVNVQVLVTQGTNPGSLPIDGGTVTFNLTQNGTLIGVISANVSSIGLASATIPLPTNLSVGSYTITASYANANGGPANPHGAFASTAAITLNIAQASPPSPPAPPIPPTPPAPPPVSPQTAALELAIDTAALLLQGNPIALAKLQFLSTALFQYTVPTSISALTGSIQSLFPQAGSLGLSAIEAGISLAQSLQQGNP